MKNMLYEGKAKQVYLTENADEYLIHYKDDATAFNGEKKDVIMGKGELNLAISTVIFEMLEKEGIKMAEAELTMIPQNYVDLTDPEVVKKFTRILDLLDEDDDVQAVYHNANLPDEE